MKIAIVYDAIFPFIKGGGEKRYYDFAKVLSKDNEVTFYGMHLWSQKSTSFKKEGLNYQSISKSYPLYNKDGKRTISESLLFGLSSIKMLKYDYDIIECSNFPYFSLFGCKLASIIKNKPLITTWHEVWGKEYWQQYLGKYKGYIGYIVEYLSSKLPNRIISVSELTTSRLIKELGVNPNKIITIPNAIDINKINKIKASKEKSDIIFAGRLISHKNVDLLINSISILKKQNKNIKCIIIGDGPEINALKKLTKELSLNNNIIFKGFLKNENDIYAYMKSSKVLALPSEREGFGIVAIEALACGLPVITIDAKDNASKYLIKPGKTGYISKKDKDEYSRSLKKALKSYISMKNSCKEEANRYDQKEIIKHVEEVYNKA